MPGLNCFPYKGYMKIGYFHTLNYRSHRKIVVIDGKIGYIGGLNLDKEQLPGGNRLGSWRDTHLRIEGEAAHALQATFAISWYNTTQEKLDTEDIFPQDGFEPAAAHTRANHIGRTRLAVVSNAAVVFLYDHDRREKGPDPIALFHSR